MEDPALAVEAEVVIIICIVVGLHYQIRTGDRLIGKFKLRTSACTVMMDNRPFEVYVEAPEAMESHPITVIF